MEAEEIDKRLDNLRTRVNKMRDETEIKEMSEAQLDKEYKVTVEVTIVASDELEALTTVESYISTRADFQLVKVEKTL